MADLRKARRQKKYLQFLLLALVCSAGLGATTSLLLEGFRQSRSMHDHQPVMRLVPRQAVPPLGDAGRAALRYLEAARVRWPGLPKASTTRWLEDAEQWLDRLVVEAPDLDPDRPAGFVRRDQPTQRLGPVETTVDCLRPDQMNRPVAID